MRPDAQNLQAIDKAVRWHESACDQPLLAIVMNPYEVDRLGWDDYKGIPIESDTKIPTGIFRLVCDGEHSGSGAATEDVAQEVLAAAGSDVSQ